MNEIVKHYEKCREIITTFGYDPITDSYRLGNKDFTGWYYNGRCYNLVKDFDKLKTCRTIYCTLNFVKKPESFGKGRLPSYKHIETMNLFADVDLQDEIKEDVKQKGFRPEKLREVGVDVIYFMYDKFVEFAGDPNSVLLLDSGGGFYVLIHHNVLTPIAREFGEKRGIIFQEVCKRFNRQLKVIREEISAKIPEFSKYFKIDLLNNVNRLFKAPMSVHKSLPYVVHPINPKDPDFEEMVLNKEEGLIHEHRYW